MNLNYDKKKGMLLGAIIGNALGTPLYGLGKGHIYSIFKSIDNYVDPTPALKGKLEIWKKPGLYSSASQMILILCYIASIRKFVSEKQLLILINKLPEVADSEFGIFRHPYTIVRHFLKKAKLNGVSSENGILSYPVADVVPYCVSSIFQENTSEKEIINNALSLSFIFNHDVFSITGVTIFSVLINSIVDQRDSFSFSKILSFAVEKINIIYNEMDKISAKIFDYGINPDYLLLAIKDYYNILTQLVDSDKKETAEKIICDYVNQKIKTPITRATVNHPLAIVPYSIFLTANSLNNPSEILSVSASEGGTASVLCALTGILTGALFGAAWLPSNLVNGLVNKKRIFEIVEAILRSRISESTIIDFFKNEALLTAKEIQEKKAKIKHYKPKKKPKKTYKKTYMDRDRDLSKHVVESWTKVDQAKWRKKSGKDKEESFE